VREHQKIHKYTRARRPIGEYRRRSQSVRQPRRRHFTFNTRLSSSLFVSLHRLFSGLACLLYYPLFNGFLFINLGARYAANIKNAALSTRLSLVKYNYADYTDREWNPETRCGKDAVLSSLIQTPALSSRHDFHLLISFVRSIVVV
jgi:hypothetical protein